MMLAHRIIKVWCRLSATIGALALPTNSSSIQRFAAAAVLLTTLLASANVGSNDYADHRLRLGEKMFPHIIGGNLDLSKKQNKDGKLLLVVFYQHNRTLAEEIADRLQSTVKYIYKYQIRITVTNDISFQGVGDDVIAGIFFSEQLADDQRNAILQFSSKHQIIVFSSFHGDVAAGVTAGLYIATQVKPALNLTTINKASIRINNLFFKVAKIYD